MSKEKKAYKITAIIIVVIFIIIVVAGIIHELKQDSNPTESQLIAARLIVSKDLSDKGDNITKYSFSASIEHKNSMKVVLSYNSTIKEYIINTGSGQIMMYKQVDKYNYSEDKDE